MKHEDGPHKFGKELIGILLAVCVHASSYAEASLAPFDGIGGDGGAPYRLDCGESAVLVGITGRSGAVIDRLGGLCVKIEPVSGTWVGGIYETSSVGGNGGGAFRRTCSVGRALVGLEGTSMYFSGTHLVTSLNIVCAELKIRTQYTPPVIRGFRQVGIYGDPNPFTVPSLQDLCYRPLAGTNRSQDDWSHIGVALEGRAGLYVDRVHLVCGELLTDQQGYRVTFHTSAKTAVPEGTPLNIQWRATGAKPELTPNLQYSWELQDWTHTRPAALFGQQPTIVQNPCGMATQPCSGGWYSESGSQITFNALPPAKYELLLKVRPTVPAPVESRATHRFEILPNQLVEIKVTPDSIHPGQGSTATITLEGSAPPQGKKIYLSSSNPQLVPVPPSLVIPGGAAMGTVSLRAAPSSLGQVTITASLTEFLVLQGVQSGVNAPLSSGILSRGVEGEDLAALPAEEVPIPPGNEPELVAPEQLSDQNQDVTERGIAGLRVRPSIGLSQAAQSMTGGQKPPFGEATQISPGVATALLTQPGSRKHTVLMIQPEIEMQRNFGVGPSLDRFKRP